MINDIVEASFLKGPIYNTNHSAEGNVFIFQNSS